MNALDKYKTALAKFPHETQLLLAAARVHEALNQSVYTYTPNTDTHTPNTCTPNTYTLKTYTSNTYTLNTYTSSTCTPINVHRTLTLTSQTPTYTYIPNT